MIEKLKNILDLIKINKLIYQILLFNYLSKHQGFLG